MAFNAPTGGQDVHDGTGVALIRDGKSGVNHCGRPGLANFTDGNNWQPFNYGEGWDILLGGCK